MQPPGNGRELALVLSAFLIPLFVAACQRPMDQSGDMEADILAALSQHGQAPVIVALVRPPGYGEPAADQDALRAAIARMQSEIVTSMDSADFRVRTRFESIPALAGTVLSERGLRQLLAHAHVRRVDLDPAGGGTR